jgi:hypothetical protein
MLYKGQKVVCVDVDYWYPNGTIVNRRAVVADLHGLRKGQVYTVRGDAGPCWIDGQPTVYLEEIIRPLHRGDCIEVGYFACRFRPVVDRKTELPACITALLDTSKFKELCGND